MANGEVQRGRPRSEAARVSVLSATRDLLRLRGYDALTLAEVASRAGVGRQTVYRWWTSKAMVVADCVLEGFVALPMELPAATGDPANDLGTWLKESHDRLSSGATAPLVRALTAAASTDETATSRLADLFAPVRDAVRTTLRAGEAAGTTREGVNPDAITDLLVGSLIYAVVSRDFGASRRAGDALRVLLSGIGAPVVPS